MKTLTKTIFSLVTASILATSAFASSNDSPYEQAQGAKARVEALSATLENMGVNVDTSVDLNGANTFQQKAAVYNAKHAELQAEFNSLHAQSAE